MISYEKELDIDNKLHNYLKTTGLGVGVVVKAMIH